MTPLAFPDKAARNAYIVAQRRRGVPLRIIGRRVGISPSMVGRIAVAAGARVIRWPGCDSALQTHRDEVIVWKLQRGFTQQAVAAEHNLTPQRIHQIASQHGIRSCVRRDA